MGSVCRHHHCRVGRGGCVERGAAHRCSLQVLPFSSDVASMGPLTVVNEDRDQIRNRVLNIVEGGNTRLYDAVLQTYRAL